MARVLLTNAHTAGPAARQWKQGHPVPSLTARWLALVLALLAALYLCWLMLQPFVDVLLWALVLAVVFMPVHRRILTRLGSPTTSAVLSTLLVVVTILVPATFITVAVVGELTQLAGSLASGESQVWKVQRLITQATEWLKPWIDLSPSDSKTIADQVERCPSGALSWFKNSESNNK